MKKFSWILIPLTFFAVWFMPLRVTRIECYTTSGSCPNNYLASLNKFLGFKILHPLPASQIQASLKSYPEVASIDIYRRLPQTLVVSITQSTPLGVIGPNVLGAKVSLADTSGKIISQVETTVLPLLVVDSPPSPPSQLSSDQLQALKQLSTLMGLSQTRLIGSLTGSDLHAWGLLTGCELVLDLYRPIQDWYPSLQLILNRSRISAKLPKKIDIRFGNPVVMY